MRKSSGALWSLALLFGGCPKRQTTPRIVYIPAPPATVKAPTTTATLVIREPQQPSPPAAVPVSKPVSPAPARRPPIRRPKPSASPPQIEHTPVPELEPRESPALQKALRSNILRMQREVQGAINRLYRSGLPESELDTLGGAQVFLAQSIRALQDNDLQRALNLVRKAQLLVQALERSP